MSGPSEPTTGRGRTQTDPAIRRLSAIPGRERWKADSIKGKPRLAAALQEAIGAFPGVLEAEANPLTGRVLILFIPGTPQLDCGVLIDQRLAELAPREDLAERGRPRRPALGRVLKLSLPSGQRLLLPPLLSVLGEVLQLVQGLSYTATVNTARGDIPDFLKRPGLTRPGWRLPFMAGISLLLTGANTWLQPYRRRAWHELGQETEQALRARLFEQILAQDVEFFDQRGAAALVQLSAEDSERVAAFVDRGGDQIVGKLVVLVFTGVSLLSTSPLLAIFALASVPFFLLPTVVLDRRLSEAHRRHAASAERLRNALENSLSGIADVKSFTAERREMARLRERGERAAADSVAVESLSKVVSQLIDTIAFLGLYVTAAYSGHLAAAGRISQSSYTNTLYLIPKLLSVPANLEGITRLYNRARHSADRIAAVLDREPAIRGGRQRLRRAQVEGRVTFDRVSFGYDSSRPVLHDVSFELPPGRTLAIVGPTGSGKSTLLRLLLRFYDVDSGSVELDGRDIRQLDLEDLRAAISLVGQEAHLFEATIRDNVVYGRPAAGDDEIHAALAHAGAAGLVERRPGGLESMIGAQGGRLSGGERQRLAIARALLKGGPVLALDEATSSLDYETEAAVQRSIRQVAAESSVIMVAHRLSSIRHADQILVLEAGRVRELGRHDELVAQGGLYASLWALQQGEGPLGASLELKLVPPEERR